MLRRADGEAAAGGPGAAVGFMPGGSLGCGGAVISLLASQNPDGGWPYQAGGPSWTEPTAYALLALVAQGSAAEPVMQGLRWLKAAQLSDGGWPPEPVVRQSTWVTAATALLGPAQLGDRAYSRGIAWILRQVDADSGLLMGVRHLLTGQSPSIPGWPWFPGTGVWVTPTALSMLALRQALRFSPSQPIRARLGNGAACLLAHACSDGGWNHGAARALGLDARSYPETTGVALLALAGQDSPQVRKACVWAEQHLPDCQTSEGESWLRLGLLAQGRLTAGCPPAMRTPRTIQNVALAALAASAAVGRNPFLE